MTRKRVLVVGDSILDEYLRGEVRRVSPEAPVPVVDYRERVCLPGGAANAAANVLGLGGEVRLISVLGADEAAGRLKQALERAGIATSGLLRDPERPTTTKTRVVAQTQHIVRIDHESRNPISKNLLANLQHQIEESINWCDACLLSDYAKGVMTPELSQFLIGICNRQGRPVVVDPKGSDGQKYRGATLVKPNLSEAGQLLGKSVDALWDTLAEGEALLQNLQAKAILFTRGPQGMILFEPDQNPHVIEARRCEVYDVTGAGDTVAATVTLALAAQIGFLEAARLAARTAAAVVGRVGTATARPEDLND